jgi:cystathionine beta-lyase/cystathionine gamma-synthase
VEANETSLHSLAAAGAFQSADTRMAERRISTQFVHAGERKDPPHGRPVATPIYASSAFTYDSMETVDKVFSGEAGDFVYTRYGNPTIAAFESAMQTLENGSAAVAYGSGMAALHAALFACDLGSGSTVLASQDLYGATFDLLYKVFGVSGVKTVTADFDDLAAVREKALATKPAAILIETISNPLLKVCDIEGVSAIAREVGARVIVDNTFASPFLSRPLDLGADFSVHSATKYLGGHADALGGVVIAKKDTDRLALVSIMKLVGGIMSVWEAHQISRGIKTLGLRVQRQCENATRIAAHFKDDPRLAKVHHPSLASDQARVAKVLRAPHAGALVSFELKDNTKDAAFRFMNTLQLCVRLTSLGDVFTGVSHSASSSHREVSPAQRRRLGITDGLVRISVGIEDADDIITDLDQALGK